MIDKSTRSREREGELDLPSILRAAPDSRRRLGLLRLVAGLRHQAAERWGQDLGLAPAVGRRPWLALGRSAQRLWIADCAEQALEAVASAGHSVNPLSRAAIRVARAFASGTVSYEELIDARKAATQPMRELRGPALSAAIAAYWAAGLAGLPELPALALEAASSRVSAGPYERWGLAPPPGSDTPEYLAERERLLTHLRDAYLWPEVVRP